MTIPLTLAVVLPYRERFGALIHVCLGAALVAAHRAFESRSRARVDALLPQINATGTGTLNLITNPCTSILCPDSRTPTGTPYITVSAPGPPSPPITTVITGLIMALRMLSIEYKVRITAKADTAAKEGSDQSGPFNRHQRRITGRR
jgi:hypothetical protein